MYSYLRNVSLQQLFSWLGRWKAVSGNNGPTSPWIWPQDSRSWFAETLLWPLKTKRKEKTAQQHQDVALNKEARYTLQERKMMKRYVMSDSQILTGKVSEDRDKRDVTVSQQPETERGREGNGLLHPSRSSFTAVTCLIIKDRVRCLARCCSSNCTLYTREWWRVPARKAENLTERTTPLVTERLYCFAFIWPLISSHRCIRQGVSELHFKVFLLSSHYTPPSRFDKPAIKSTPN